MLNRFALAIACLALTACGGTAPAPSESTDASEATPLDDLLPWDGDAVEVQTTESGLQYRILSEGPADGLSPRPQDEVQVMYEGRLPDGTVFDSSYERGSPSSFGVSAVISGWTEGLQLMSVGDEYAFYIPNDLAYGNQARGDVIKAGDDLVFRVELLDVDQPPPPRTVDAEAWSKFTPGGGGNPGVQ
ncbi:MAG: FKBP-type peptidyl-prolyl cis-trans isomerase, partial [Pseudomonadota bacterium]